MKIADIFNFGISSILVSFITIWKRIKSVDKFIVKSDDEAIDALLETDEDKNKFREKVNDMIKNHEETSEISINNKRITISI